MSLKKKLLQETAVIANNHGSLIRNEYGIISVFTIKKEENGLSMAEMRLDELNQKGKKHKLSFKIINCTEIDFKKLYTSEEEQYYLKK